MPSHEVVNQPPPLVDWDVAADAGLESALVREGAGYEPLRWAAVHVAEALERLACNGCVEESQRHGDPWRAARRARWGVAGGRAAGKCRRGRLKS